VGVLYPDGGENWNVARAVKLGLTGMAPLFAHLGTERRGKTHQLRYWLWPLPGEGPLTFRLKHDDPSVASVAATVDGHVIRKALEDCRPVWPRPPMDTDLARVRVRGR